MRENADHNNSEYRHFLSSECFLSGRYDRELRGQKFKMVYKNAIPAAIYLFKVNNRNTKTMYEIDFDLE